MNINESMVGKNTNGVFVQIMISRLALIIPFFFLFFFKQRLPCSSLRHKLMRCSQTVVCMLPGIKRDIPLYSVFPVIVYLSVSPCETKT